MSGVRSDWSGLAATLIPKLTVRDGAEQGRAVRMRINNRASRRSLPHRYACRVARIQGATTAERF
jgi:hypothetical protein